MVVVSEKVLFGGFRQLFFTFVSQSHSGVKVAWVVDMSHPIHLQSAESDLSSRGCCGILIILWVHIGLIFVWLTFCFLVVLHEAVTAPESLVSGWWLRCDQPRCDVVSFGCCCRRTWSTCLTRNVWLRTFGATYRFEGDPTKNGLGVGWLGESWRKYLIFAWEWIGWMGCEVDGMWMGWLVDRLGQFVWWICNVRGPHLFPQAKRLPPKNASTLFRPLKSGGYFGGFGSCHACTSTEFDVTTPWLWSSSKFV